MAAGAEPERLTLQDLTPDAGRALAGGDAVYDISPDGGRIICTWSVPEQGGARVAVMSIDVASGERTTLLNDPDYEYGGPRISPDGRTLALVVIRREVVDKAADQWLSLVDLGTGEVRPLTADWDRWPGHPVLPKGASADSPVPLLLWIHGGPLGSWNAWAWRWNPWLAAAQGYAVLLPDPAISTGYGWDFIQRGRGAWGAAPYTDLMALTDATVARTGIDASRTGAMGGSFGGYMANWVAGHTTRFKGIVTQASVWALDQFGPTTDEYHYWRRELAVERILDNSPHLHIDAIRTPMLVIHGDRDYRIPIGESLRLWAELSERHLGADGTTPHKFLYFPDENHWVLSPQHAKVWYDTVFAFLTSTVLDGKLETPDILR